MTYDESFILLLISYMVFIFSVVQILTEYKNRTLWIFTFALAFSVGAVIAFFAYQDYGNLLWLFSIIFFLQALFSS